MLFVSRIPFVVAIVLSLIASMNVFGIAQTPTATVTGIVLDSTGAVLAGVQITATSTDRNTTSSTITNDSGSYVLPTLNPGEYRSRPNSPDSRDSSEKGSRFR